jgi:hypothetical protein
MLDDIVRPEMEQFRKGNGFFLAMPGRNFSNQDLRDSLSQLRIQSDLLRDSAYTETLRGDLSYTPKQRFIYLAQEIRIVLLEHRSKDSQPTCRAPPKVRCAELNREDSEWEHEFLVAHIESKPGEYGLLVLDRCRGNDFRTVSGEPPSTFCKLAKQSTWFQANSPRWPACPLVIGYDSSTANGSHRDSSYAASASQNPSVSSTCAHRLPLCLRCGQNVRAGSLPGPSLT